MARNVFNDNFGFLHVLNTVGVEECYDSWKDMHGGHFNDIDEWIDYCMRKLYEQGIIGIKMDATIPKLMFQP